MPNSLSLWRPLGAVVEDFLDKPLDKGGLALNRFSASALLALFMLMCTLLFLDRSLDRAS